MLPKLYKQYKECTLWEQSMHFTKYTQDAVCRLVDPLLIPAESREVVN